MLFPDSLATPNAGSNAKNAVSKSGPGPTEQPSPRSGRYRCICGLSYTVIYNLHRHQRDKGCLLAGMSSNSPVEVTAASASGPFFCPYPNCGKKIQFERNYRSHITFHETEERKWAQIRAEQTTPQVQTGSDEITSVSKSSASMTVDAAAIDVQMEIELWPVIHLMTRCTFSHGNKRLSSFSKVLISLLTTLANEKKYNVPLALIKCKRWLSTTCYPKIASLFDWYCVHIDFFYKKFCDADVYYKNICKMPCDLRIDRSTCLMWQWLQLVSSGRRVTCHSREWNKCMWLNCWSQWLDLSTVSIFYVFLCKSLHNNNNH